MPAPPSSPQSLHANQHIWLALLTGAGLVLVVPMHWPVVRGLAAWRFPAPLFRRLSKATPIPSHNHSAVPTLKPGITDDDIAQAVVLSSFLGSPRKVVKVGSDMVAKLGPGLDLIEGEAMRFIRSHTGIPMPKVLDVFEKDGCGYILMEYVGGGRPDEVWHNLSADEQETIVSELSGYISQVGQIACPGGTFIRSVTGGPEADRRFSSICGGPFQSEADLNK